MTRTSFVGAALVLLMTGVASATGYDLTLIAVTGGEFDSLGASSTSLNELGHVAYRGVRSDTSKAIMLWDGSNAAPLYDTASASAVLTDFAFPSLNESGRVAFHGTVGGGGSARRLFTGAGGALTTIASTTGFVGGEFQNFSGAMHINNTGQVGFTSTRNGVRGIHVGDGGPVTTLYDVATNYPTLGQFSSIFTNAAFNDAGQVAFFASLDAGGAGVFLGDGTAPPTTIQLNQDADPTDLTIDYVNFANFPTLTQGGLVAFNGFTSSAGGQNAFGDGTLPLTVIANSLGPFDGFVAAFTSDRGHVGFTGFLDAGGSGAFAGGDVVNDRIIGSGELFDETTVTSVSVVDMNEAGQYLLSLNLEDGRSALVRAAAQRSTGVPAVPEPGALALLGVSLGAVALRRFRPRRREPPE